MNYELLEALSDVIDGCLDKNKQLQDTLRKTEMELVKQEIMLNKQADRCAELKCRYMELHPKIERNDAARLFLERVDSMLGYQKER